VVYKPRDVRLVEHTLFQPGSAYLVQVNVPHRAFVTSDYRVAVSIRFSHKRTTKPHLTFCPLPRAQKFSPAPLSRANYMAYFRFAHL
jgi:hypothetical protein